MKVNQSEVGQVSRVLSVENSGTLQSSANRLKEWGLEILRAVGKWLKIGTLGRCSK